MFEESCFFDIHCVLVTQVNDQKIKRQLTVGVFFSYKSAIVNYCWGYFSLLLVFLGSIESQKTIFMFEYTHELCDILVFLFFLS